MKRFSVAVILHLLFLPQAFSIALNRDSLCEMSLKPTHESHAELESFFKELLAAQNLPAFTKFEGWQVQEQQEQAYFWVSAQIDSSKSEKIDTLYLVDMKTFQARTLFISSFVTAFSVHNKRLFVAFSKRDTIGSDPQLEITLQSFSIPDQNQSTPSTALVDQNPRKNILVNSFYKDGPSVSYHQIQKIKFESDRLLIKRAGHSDDSPREIYSY